MSETILDEILAGQKKLCATAEEAGYKKAFLDLLEGLKAKSERGYIINYEMVRDVVFELLEKFNSKK